MVLQWVINTISASQKTNTIRNKLHLCITRNTASKRMTAAESLDTDSVAAHTKHYSMNENQSQLTDTSLHSTSKIYCTLHTLQTWNHATCCTSQTKLLYFYNYNAYISSTAAHLIHLHANDHGHVTLYYLLNLIKFSITSINLQTINSLLWCIQSGSNI